VAGAAVVAVVSALALTGCSGSGEAGPTTAAAVEPSPTISTPAATPSATPTPTPTATTAASGAPKRPAGMNANTAEGARKTALYFIQLYPYVMRTGDTKEWDRLSVKKQCDFCSGVRSEALAIKQKKRTYSGGEMTAKVLTTYDRDTLYDAYPLLVRLTQKASVTREADGKVVHRQSMSSGTVVIEVMRVKGGWNILESATESQEP
jgi:hypothetical protein